MVSIKIKRVFIVAVILVVAVMISGAVLQKTNAQQSSVNCQIFADSWFPAVETYDDGCGSAGTAKQKVVANGVSFDAVFGFYAEIASNWDSFARENTKDGDVQTLPFGSFGIRSQRVAVSYDSQNNEYQEVYATYRARYNTCATDFMISGTGPANDKSYAGKVFAAVESKIKENLEKMKKIAPCNSQEITPPSQTATPPSPTTTKTPKQPSSPQTTSLPSELPAQPMEGPQDDVVEVNIDKIAGYKSQVREEAKKVIEMKKCPGPPLPSKNPCVAEKLNFILVRPAESYLKVSFLDQQKKEEPVILDSSEKWEVIGLRDSFSRAPSVDLTKLRQMLDVHEAMWNDLEKNFPKPTQQPEFQSPFARSADGSEFSLILVGENAPEWQNIQFKTELSSPSAIVTGESPVQITIPDNATVEFKGIFRLLPNKSVIDAITPVESKNNSPIWEVLDGGAHIDKSDNGKAIKVQTPLTATKSKHTKFSVLYNPEELYAVTIAYEGEVEVTDILNGLTTTLAPTENGRPRALIVALEETAVGAKKSAIMWIAVILLALAGISYLFYRNKGAIFSIIKKRSM